MHPIIAIGTEMFVNDNGPASGGINPPTGFVMPPGKSLKTPPGYSPMGLPSLYLSFCTDSAYVAARAW